MPGPDSYGICLFEADDLNNMNDKHILEAISYTLELLPFLKSMTFNLDGCKSH